MFIILIILAFWIPIMLAPFEIVWAFDIGRRALLQSTRARQPYATTLRFLALNLCEPLLNGAIVALLVFPVIGLPMTGIVYVPYTHSAYELGLLLSLPMAVLLLPAAGLAFPETTCRRVSRGLLLAGLLRWSITFLLWWAACAYRRNNTPDIPFHILLLEVLGLLGLWLSIRWGRRQITILAARSGSATIGGDPPASPGSAGSALAGGPIRVLALPVLFGVLLAVSHLLAWLSLSTLPPTSSPFDWDVDHDTASGQPWEPVEFTASITSRIIREPPEEFRIAVPDLPPGWSFRAEPGATLRVAPGATEQVVIRIIPADTWLGTYHLTVAATPVRGNRPGWTIVHGVDVTVEAPPSPPPAGCGVTSCATPQPGR